MRRFWDDRARENALFFVDSQLEYADPDAERFFANGEHSLDVMLGALGASLDPGDRVVEIGCGAGRQTRALAARAAHVRALDVSEAMLARARELSPGLGNVEWLPGDGTSLAGIDSGSADACVSYVVFQHLPDPELTLGYVREMGRVLRPGGWAAFQVSDDSSIHRPRWGRARMATALRGLLGRGPRGQANAAWRGSAVDLAELGAVAAGAGMELERAVGEGTQFCLVLLRRR